MVILPTINKCYYAKMLERIFSLGVLLFLSASNLGAVSIHQNGVPIDTTTVHIDVTNTFSSTQTINAQDSSGYSLKTSSSIVSGGCYKFGNGTIQCQATSTSTIVDLGNSGTGFAINWSSSTFIYLTLTGNATLAFSGAESGGKYTLALKQDGTGSRTVTWPAAVRHSGGTAPTLTTTAAKTDYVGFLYNSVDAKYDLVSFAPNY